MYECECVLVYVCRVPCVCEGECTRSAEGQSDTLRVLRAPRALNWSVVLRMVKAA